MVKRLEHHMGCCLDGACHFHQYIDGIASRQHRRIVGQHRAPTGDCRFRLLSRRGTIPFHDAGLPECPLTVVCCPIRDRYETNPRCRSSKLQGDGTACRTGSDHPDANRVTVSLTLPQGGVYNHALSFIVRLLPLQERPIAILVRNHGGNQGPLNTERRIIKSYSAY